MDWKCTKGIKKFIFLIVIVCIFLIVVSGIFCKWGMEIYGNQLLELCIIHSDLEIELQENFQFYKENYIFMFFMFVGVVVVLCITFSCFSFFMGQKLSKQEIFCLEDEMNCIYEQMLEYRKGNFVMHEIAIDSKAGTGYRRIQELLQELGYYFSDLKEKLQEEENNTKRLITDISHQLKTPLASLKMSYELAKSENFTKEERKEFLESEEKEILKLEILLEELVNLSRLENNMIQLKPECRNIKEAIKEAVNQEFMKAYAKNIDINVIFSKDVIEVFYDIKWTVEALANIIDNGIKYSDRGKVIQIRISVLPTNVLIEIEDEGIGILEDELHHIFKRFYRGMKAKEYEKEGAGVGLYLARNIIEQQGGTIVAKRKIDKGSLFKITLPLA